MALLLRMLICALAVLAGTGSTQAHDLASVNFALRNPVLDLKGALSPYHAASLGEADGSHWYLMTAVNESVLSVTRILLADESGSAYLRLFPRRGRAAIRQVAASDAGVIAENAHPYGRYAFRVTIPPATSVALALRLSDADAVPAVQAWSEPALTAHIRRAAVLSAAVAGLIAAALAIVGGLAVVTGQTAARWAALTLGSLLLVRLASAGAFDAIGIPAVGGPYGMIVMLAGATLVAGLRLADSIAPLEDAWPRARIWFEAAVTGVLGFSALSFLGMPGAMLLTEAAIVAGAGSITAYLVHCGRRGAPAARAAAPSAFVFSLVTTGMAVAMLCGWQHNTAVLGAVGGFSAAAAVLVALAVAAGGGIAALPMHPAVGPTGAESHALRAEKDAAQSLGGASEALQAIAASCQGILDLDLQDGLANLSPEAAALARIGTGAQKFSLDEWIMRIHPDDRDTFRDGLAEFGGRPETAFRIEFRLRAGPKDYSWLEFRGRAVGNGRARCTGLLADVTARRAADGAAA